MGALSLVGCADPARLEQAPVTAPSRSSPGQPAPSAGNALLGQTKSRVTLTGGGATLPFPLYTRWLSEFTRGKALDISYESIGSGGGIRKITEHTLDFGASDAPLTEDQLGKAPGILHIPTCGGAVALAYNLQGVPTGLKITPEAAAGIFLGKVKEWDEPILQKENPDVKLPKKTIVSVHRADGNSATKLFVEYLSAVSPEWKSGPGAGFSVPWPAGLGARGNEGVSHEVSKTYGAIGYVTFDYAAQNKLSLAAIKNAAGKFVMPSVESVTAAAAGAVAKMPEDLRVSLVNAEGEGAYPVSGLTYVLVYKEQADVAKGKALVDFLEWAIHDGQKLTKDLYYAPLPPQLVEKVETKLASVTFSMPARPATAPPALLSPPPDPNAVEIDGGCQAAKAAYVAGCARNPASCPETDPSKLVGAGAYQAVLNRGTYLVGCGVPSSMEVKICVAVRSGRAIAATVTSTPADRAIATCVGRAVQALSYPNSPGLDIATTVFTAR
jgi:phosphate transport system substrate-binding protein